MQRIITESEEKYRKIFNLFLSFLHSQEILKHPFSSRLQIILDLPTLRRIICKIRRKRLILHPQQNGHDCRNSHMILTCFCTSLKLSADYGGFRLPSIKINLLLVIKYICACKSKSKASTSLRVSTMSLFWDSSKDTVTNTNKTHFRLSFKYQALYAIVISSGEY